MWSHYASGHQGVAIEIEFAEESNNLYKVDYNEGLQKFGTTILAGATAAEVLSVKTNHWAHEKEYRVIQQHEYFEINGKVTGLYLGIRVSDNMRGLLIKAVPTRIPIFNTRLDKANVKVEPAGQINAQQGG